MPKRNFKLLSLGIFIIAMILVMALKLSSTQKNSDVASISSNQTVEVSNNENVLDGKNDEKLERKTAEAMVKVEEQKRMEEEKRKQEAEAKKQAEIKKQEEIKIQQAAQAKKAAETKKQQDISISSNQQPFKTESRIIDTLPLSNSKQAIIVKGASNSSVNINFEVYERDSDNTWQLKWNTNGVVGLRGMSANRHEGDLTTPMGIYGFPFQFGSAPNPGVKMEYRQTRPGDLWASNPNNINEYNVWVHYDGNDPKVRYGDIEDLNSKDLYKYAVVVDFNYWSNKVIGKGSGIFLHIAPYSGGGTLGCVGIPETKLVEVLKWMDPNKNPRIIIGTESYLRNLR